MKVEDSKSDVAALSSAHTFFPSFLLSGFNSPIQGLRRTFKITGKKKSTIGP